MATFRRKQYEIEAITFDELVEYGKANSINFGEMDGSFRYKGELITVENKECYLMHSVEVTHKITPQDMLITDPNGITYSLPTYIFEHQYEVADA